MGRSKGHIPIRTCVSCGAKKSKSQLIRLAIDGSGQLVRDVSGRMFGRGAYICKLSPCRDKLFKNKRLKNIFRTDSSITIDPDMGE